MARMQPTLESDAVVRQLPVGGHLDANIRVDAPVGSHLFRELNRVTTSSSLGEASRHFDALLHNVLRELAHIAGSARAALYLTRDGTTFHARAWIGVEHRVTSDARLRTMRSDADVLLAELVRARAPVTTEHGRSGTAAIAGLLRRFNASAMTALPLALDDELIGAVLLGGRHDADEQPRLDRCARLAQRLTPWIRQAEFVLALRRRVDRARQDRDMIERSRQAQLRLDLAAIDGCCLEELTVHISEVIGRPVLLLDATCGLLHVAGDTDLQSSLRTTWRNGPIGRYLTRQGDAASRVLHPLPALGLTTRVLLCPLDRSIDRSGALLTLEVGRPFDDVDRQVLEHAAAVARVACLTRHGSRPTDPSPRSDITSAALDAIADHAALPAVVVWLDRPDERTAHQLLEIGGAVREEPVLLPRGRGVGIIVSGVSAADITRVLRSRIPSDSPRGPHLAVVSRVAATSPGLTAAFAEVDAAATMLEQNRVAGRVLAIDDLGPSRVLLTTGGADSIRRIVRETLPPLTPESLGPTLSRALLETLRALVASDGSVREAARRLEVHENTIRYRIRRIRQLTSLDPASLGDLFQLQVALTGCEHLGFSPS